MLSPLPPARWLHPCPVFSGWMWHNMPVSDGLFCLFIGTWISEGQEKNWCVCVCVYVCVHFPGLFSVEISFNLGKAPRRAWGLPWPWAKGVANMRTLTSWVLKGKGWEGGSEKEGGWESVLKSLTCEKIIYESKTLAMCNDQRLLRSRWLRW